MALGIGAAVAAAPWVASADELPPFDPNDLSVSLDGITLFQQGNATATTPDHEDEASVPAALRPPAALMSNGAVLPNPLLAELISGGAKISVVRQPGDASSPKPGYRPSAALERFIRCRDMTCRFPNCDRSAEYCDIDREDGMSLAAAV